MTDQVPESIDAASDSGNFFDNVQQNLRDAGERISDHADQVHQSANTRIEQGLDQLSETVDGITAQASEMIPDGVEDAAEAAREFARDAVSENDESQSASEAETVEAPADASDPGINWDEVFDEKSPNESNGNTWQRILEALERFANKIQEIFGRFEWLGWFGGAGSVAAAASTGAAASEAVPTRTSGRHVEARGLRDANEIAELTPEQQDWYGWSISALNHYNCPPDPGVATMFALFKRESSLGTNMYNSKSSATGLGQFVNGTWEGFIESEGAEMVRLGIATPEDIADPRDESRTVRVNNTRLMIYATAWLLDRSANALERNGFENVWRREDAAYLLYACHHLGEGDGPKYLRYLETGDESILASMKNPDLINEGAYEDVRDWAAEYSDLFRAPEAESLPIAKNNTILVGDSHSDGMRLADRAVTATGYTSQNSHYFNGQIDNLLDQYSSASNFVLFASVNDVWQPENPSYENIIANYENMIQAVRAAGKTPYLCTTISFEPDPDVDESQEIEDSTVTRARADRVRFLNQRITTLGNRMNVPVISLESITSNRLHPDRATYQGMVDAIFGRDSSNLA